MSKLTEFAKKWYRFIRKPKYILHEYHDDDGKFDYHRYKDIQIAGNKKKIESRWVQEQNIAFLADYLKQNCTQIQFGICHGTRRGKEQEWFRKYLGCEVIGTEISDTATQFPYTIEWDFHNVKEEWINNVDFIYSNSYDHSYDPQSCLNNWMRCIKKGGFCFLEYSKFHGPEQANEMDPFGVKRDVFIDLINEWGQGRYGVKEVLRAPEKYVTLPISMIVIQELSC